MAGKATRQSRPSPAMNVTPLVDIVLVLLIIFMVVLPSMDSQAAVDLPTIHNVDEEPEGRTDPATVSITADERYFLDDGSGAASSEELSRDELNTRLRQLHEGAPLRRILLRGDASLSYGRIRTLFATCQEIGFPGVALRVGQRSDESPLEQGER